MGIHSTTMNLSSGHVSVSVNCDLLDLRSCGPDSGVIASICSPPPPTSIYSLAACLSPLHSLPPASAFSHTATELKPTAQRGRMLMTAVHMDSASTTTPPHCLPVLAHHRQLLHDFTSPASASALSTPPPAPSSHHHQLVPLRVAPSSARRRVASKRRPRPSRRLPTTYISADPASFRRMVHEVTGADDLPPQPNNVAELLLTRPEPVRAAAVGGAYGSTTPISMLPTLDTSAFLLPRTRTDARCCDGSPSSTALTTPDNTRGACSSSGSGGFPTLESWDHHAPLFF